jgi:TatD DNase family protein
MGLHPWHVIENNWLQELEALKQHSKNASVKAIGECGLDKVCETGFTLQQTVFQAQISWANHLHKPLILHCVKAFEETQQFLKKNNNNVPVIFHGFNKGLPTALKLIENGFYLSFGKALQMPNVQAVAAHVPLSQLFLETDDSTIPIQQVYDWATITFKIDKESLILQLQKNKTAVFGSEAE